MSADSGDTLLGTVGRVTVSIPADGPGEVLLPVRGGSEAFAAWSDEPIPRHCRIVVVDCISARSVFVTPVLAGPQRGEPRSHPRMSSHGLLASFRAEPGAAD